MKGWLRVLGKKLSSIKCIALAVSVGMILIFSACSKWEIPEMLTETEMLSYMRDRYGLDFVICDVEDQGETGNTLMVRTYWMYPEGNEDMIITVSEVIRKGPTLCLTDPVYVYTIRDSYTGELFTQQLSGFLDDHKIKYKKELDISIVVYLDDDTFAQQIRDICAFGNELNECAPFNTKAALDAAASITFCGSQNESICYPFQMEEPYIVMDSDEIIASYIGDLFINYCINFLDNKGIDYMKDANNRLVIYLDDENLSQQVQDICAFGEELNKQSPFDIDSANQANATIVFRNAQKKNISCSPFRSEKPYIVMEANEMIALLE